MDTSTLAEVTADSTQILGMSFYFDPLTGERAKENGLNIYQFYGLGRGGTLGDVPVDVVQEAFTFFHPRAIGRLWTEARAKADPVTVAVNYLQAAYQFADRTFGAVDLEILSNYAAAAHKVASSVGEGKHHLLDGYKQYDVPSSPVHAAYLGTILMRELRGCVHIDAVNQVGLSVAEACYLQDPGVFQMHGFVEDETPVITAEHEAKKQRAEALTTAMMAECFGVLSDDERRHLADGAAAMFDALKAPVPVAG